MYLNRTNGYNFFVFEGILNDEKKIFLNLQSSECKETSYKKYKCKDKNESFFKLKGKIEKNITLYLFLDKLLPKLQNDKKRDQNKIICKPTSSSSVCEKINKNLNVKKKGEKNLQNIEKIFYLKNHGDNLKNQTIKKV